MGVFSILALVLAGLVIFFVYKIYRQLLQLRKLFAQSFLQMNIQLQKRYNLVSDIVEMAKTYMREDREMLESVINARNHALQADQRAMSDPANSKTMEKLIEAEANLNSSFQELLNAFEEHPDLKENESVTQMMQELFLAEHEISSARENYNGNVVKYNTVRTSMPNKMLASVFAFWPACFFEEKREKPKKSA